MRILEQRMMETGEASFANASMVDMQQVFFLSLHHIFDPFLFFLLFYI